MLRVRLHIPVGYGLAESGFGREGGTSIPKVIGRRLAEGMHGHPAIGNGWETDGTGSRAGGEEHNYRFSVIISVCFLMKPKEVFPVSRKCRFFLIDNLLDARFGTQ